MEPLKKILLCLRNVFTKKDDSVIPTDFSDLAPLDSIDNTSEYLNALDWALKNRRIRNVALCGPYGAGKSSIINSYLKSHADAQQKSLRISMATFIESKTEESDSSHSVALKPDEIETGILKQLFYKVPHTKIPQSRYRKLHKGGKLIAWRNLVLISIFLLLLGFIFAPDHVINVTNILYETWPFSTLPAKVAIVAFAVLFTGVLGSIAWCFYPAFSRMKISSISISAKANVEGDEESKESIFNKNMDEIVYFFEETRYRYVFFEDLDRLNDAAIFVRLRELNTLLNNDDEIKDPVVFIYAVRDDIFSNEDRTKFFDFLIPIVPFINSTNSGEELSKRLEASKKKEFLYNISSSFIDDVSPFISDMRILKNIYNEFIIYKNTLQAEPNLELSDESMMALMVFKNLYPKEFAELQKEQGIVKQAFRDKVQFVNIETTSLNKEIANSSEILEKIQQDNLQNVKELKVAMLYAAVGNAQILEVGQYSYDLFMQDDFDFSVLTKADRQNIYFHNRSYGSIYEWKDASFFQPYYERWQYLQYAGENRISEQKANVESAKKQIHDISKLSLCELIEKYSASAVLSEDVRKNKLLVFLLRRGYIDEKYIYYINYFKGSSITNDDMNFILAVKTHTLLEPSYHLEKTSNIVNKLQPYEFEQKEIYNYNLLEYLLSSDLNTDKRDIFIKQLSDETKQSWEFIDTFFNTTKYKDLFIQLLSTSWPKMWKFIAENPVLTYERQIEYLSTILSCLSSDQLVLMNSDSEVTEFFNKHKDILQKLSGLDSDTLIQAISIFDVHFEDLATENVSRSVLEYTFEHNHYKINVAMISNVVRFVDADRVAHLKTQNYTTVCSLGYHPLLLYIQENCTFYVKNVILREENNLEDENAVVDLIDRIFPDIALCQKLIEHENMCISKLESCCSDRLQESPDSVRQIWDFILENQKLKPIWENILIYKNAFNFTPKLISFMVSASTELGKANTENVPHSFIQDFIKANDNKAFPILIPHLRLDPFDVPLSQIAEENVSILIDYRHIPFTPDQMKELKKQYPSLQARFILQNQADAFAELDSVAMDQNLFQELLLDPRLESQYRQTLFDSYYQKYLNTQIADKVDEMGISVNHDEFEEVWQLLSGGERENFLLSHLEILNGDDFEKCFANMEPPFNLLSNRTQRNQVTVPWKDGIKQLLDRLKAVNYITSYTERAAAQQNDGSRQDEKSNSRVYTVRIKVLR